MNADPRGPVADIIQTAFQSTATYDRWMATNRQLTFNDWFWNVYVPTHFEGGMTAANLESFRARMHWNRKILGAELGISQDRLRRFLAGDQPIPRHIALACTALALGAAPMGEIE